MRLRTTLADEEPQSTRSRCGAPPDGSGGPCGAAGGHAASGRFVWPPRPFVQVPDEPPDEPPAPGGPDVPRRTAGPPPARITLHEAEAAWLGVTARSWEASRRELGWLPDAPGTYCPRCGSPAGPFEADAAGCSTCRPKRLAWERCVRLGAYEGILRDAILSGKYTGWRRMCQDLGADLGRAVAAELGLASIQPDAVAICPVPTSRRRRLARGLDHTAILAREVARVTGARVAPALRRRHRPPQQGLSPEARRANVRGAFVPRLGACSQCCGRVVVLVDDVRTTGATLSAAGRALREGVRKAGDREQAVWAAVLAVATRR